MLSPVDELSSEYSIARRENYIASAVGDTGGHGSDVLEILGFFAPVAEYNLYRVIARDGTAKRSNLADAIADAGYHGIDILNLSVGVFHAQHDNHHCGGACTIARETKLTIDDGTTAIVASGNRGADDTKATHCPAVIDESIGVGGFVSRCTKELLEDTDSGQYWVKSPELEGPFCGQRGCSESDSCSENRFEQPWRGNVSFHNADPDILGPVHFPATTDRGPLLQKGTSFATPTVSGVLACILSDLLELGQNPCPSSIKTAIRTGATELDEGAIPKLDAQNTWATLVDD